MLNPLRPRFRLLVGSIAFWEALGSDIAGARERVWVQALSFEGDSVGKRLCQALKDCGAQDKRVLVDEFTRWVQNDRFLFSPWARFDRDLQAEAAETHRMLRSMPHAGVAVRWISPLGVLGRRAAWRNHKKLVLVDRDICYLGGINFTEHNFEWHDMMLRIEHPGVAEFCARDLERSWRGERASVSSNFPGLELLNIDPPDLTPYDRIWDLLAEAREEIFVEGAYVTPPLSDALGGAARRGVRVRVVSPGAPNIPLFLRYITWEAKRHGFQLYLIPGMTHMKAILIDRETLIMGSSNLHFTGHWTQNEMLAVVTDPGLVQDFIHQVMQPDLACSKPISGSGGAAGGILRLGMKVYKELAVFGGRGRQPPPRAVS